MIALLKKYWWLTFIMGLLVAVLGVYAIIYSNNAMLVLIVALGAGLFINGFMDMFSISSSPAIFRGWLVSNTVVDILLGLLMMVLPWFVGPVIFMVFGALLVVYGFTLLVELCAFHPKNILWRLIIMTILSIGFGILLIIRPDIASKTIMIVLGAILTVLGLGTSITAIVCRVKFTTKMTDLEIKANTPTYESEAIKVEENDKKD